MSTRFVFTQIDDALTYVITSIKQEHKKALNESKTWWKNTEDHRYLEDKKDFYKQKNARFVLIKAYLDFELSYCQLQLKSKLINNDTFKNMYQKYITILENKRDKKITSITSVSKKVKDYAQYVYTFLSKSLYKKALLSSKDVVHSDTQKSMLSILKIYINSLNEHIDELNKHIHITSYKNRFKRVKSEAVMPKKYFTTKTSMKKLSQSFHHLNQLFSGTVEIEGNYFK